jgi:hypothetical protein
MLIFLPQSAPIAIVPIKTFISTQKETPIEQQTIPGTLVKLANSTTTEDGLTVQLCFGILSHQPIAHMGDQFGCCWFWNASVVDACSYLDTPIGISIVFDVAFRYNSGEALDT